MSFLRLPRKNPSNKPAGVAFVAILGLAMALWFSYSPALLTPGKDSGVFLYTGWRMLEGEKLYSEIWDHKPPLIYVIQIAGLLLGNGSRWGVWFLEALFIACAFFLAWRILSLLSRKPYAWWVAAASLIAFYRVGTGENFTETYALLPQMGILYLLLKSKGQVRIQDGLVIGILVGVVFGFRQNLIAVGIAACLVAFLYKPSLAGIVAPLAGFLLFNGLILLPFAINGTLEPFWSAVYSYNFHYADLQFAQRVAAVKDTLQFMRSDVFFGIALAGWLCFGGLLLAVIAQEKRLLFRQKRYGSWGLLLGVVFVLLSLLGDLLRGRPLLDDFGPVQVFLLALGSCISVLAWLWWSGNLEKLTARKLDWELTDTQRLAVAMVVLWLPLEIILASWSGRNFLHYYISLVPVGLVILGLSIHYVSQVKRGSVWVGVILVLVIAQPLELWIDDLQVRHDPQLIAASDYLHTHTDPDEPVWIWGAEAVVSFASQRTQPTRFSYLYPLFQFHKDAASMSAELKQDVWRQPPRIIIDTLDPQTPFPLNARGCVLPELHLQGNMQEIFGWVCAHYSFSHTVGPDQWPVYIYASTP